MKGIGPFPKWIHKTIKNLKNNVMWFIFFRVSEFFMLSSVTGHDFFVKNDHFVTFFVAMLVRLMEPVGQLQDEQDPMKIRAAMTDYENCLFILGPHRNHIYVTIFYILHVDRTCTV